MGAASITTAPMRSMVAARLGELGALVQRRVLGGVLHGVAGLVRGNHQRRQRAAVEMLGAQPDRLGIGIVVIAVLGLLHLDVAKLHLVEQMARQLPARARKIGPVRRVLGDHALHPHLWQHGQAEHDGQEQKHEGQGGVPLG